MAKAKKDVFLYRVEVDYAAAGVHKGTGTKSTDIYERKAGALSKIRAALEMNVHPKFINVQRVPAIWDLDPEFEGVCPKCWKPYNTDNEECPQNKRIDAENARREDWRTKQAAYYKVIPPTMMPLERPHPYPFVISEFEEIT